MTDSDKDINKRVERAVEAILTKHKAGNPSNIVEKTCKY
jgi:hypothetical protein